MEKTIYKNLCFRAFQADDFADVHEYGSDIEVVKYLTFGPNTVDDTENFIQNCINDSKKELIEAYNFAIEIQDGPMKGRVIGGCGLYPSKYHSVEMGYCLSKKVWGQGIGTKLVEFLLAFAFSELDVHRVFATCTTANIASAKVMEKNNMRLEGKSKSKLKLHGVFHDTLNYAILQSEWQNINIFLDLENENEK